MRLRVIDQLTPPPRPPRPPSPLTPPAFSFLMSSQQCTLWGPGELEKEVEMGLWRPVVGSKMALLRVRDRKGPDIAKPMWSDLSQMAGGEYLRVMQDFYRR